LRMINENLFELRLSAKHSISADLFFGEVGWKE